MIIGIDGFAGAGKDTIADIFVKNGFTKLSFADALRESAVYSTGFELSTFIDRNVKDKLFDQKYLLTEEVLTKFCTYLNFQSKVDEVVSKFINTEIDSPRHLLQFIGTEIGRQTLSPTIWLDKYDEKRANLGHIVTPDCRFDNERRHIKSTYKGLIWLVKRAGTEPVGKHISELDKWSDSEYDVVVQNDDLQQTKCEVGLWWAMKGSKLR